MTAVAERRDDLSGLVTNANETAGAIAAENVALSRALELLPTTLRRANTTFVNLRATLDDLDVLVAESKPATKDLAPFLRELRPLVRDARPTIRDLSTPDPPQRPGQRPRRGDAIWNGFRFGFTGTPIDRTMQNTHRDFGPLKDGEQERYLSYYGIRRAIKDGATLEVHYIRDQVPFQVDEEALNVGFEQMCEEMELEDEEAKDFIQRQRAQWKELARHPDRVEIVLEKMLDALPGAPRPERLQGAARRRRPQGLRALQGRARQEARRRAACRRSGPT